MEKLREQPRVQAGQIWKSGDPRPERQKYIKVLDVWESLVVTAKCDANGVVQYNRWGEPTTHTVLAKRFGGQRSGYVFVSGPRTEFEEDYGVGEPKVIQSGVIQGDDGLPDASEALVEAGVTETDDALIAELDAFEEEESEEEDEVDYDSYDYENERYDDDLDPEDEDGSFEQDEEVLQADDVRNEG